MQKPSLRQQFKILLLSVVAVSLLGILQFLICTSIAIYNFPDGYSFSENFLSELGLIQHEGHSLFNGSLISLGFSLLPVFAFLWFTDPRNSISIKATSIFGLISSFGIIGVGIWTFDRQFVLHHIAIALWLFPMLYMVVTFFYAASRSPFVGIGFLSVSLVMVGTMIYVLSSTQTTSVQLLQRAVVICGLIWICFIVAFIYQSGMAIINNWDEEDDTRQRKEETFLAALNRGEHRLE